MTNPEAFALGHVSAATLLALCCLITRRLGRHIL